LPPWPIACRSRSPPVGMRPDDVSCTHPTCNWMVSFDNFRPGQS
jgi:hypothetical protein